MSKNIEMGFGNLSEQIELTPLDPHAQETLEAADVLLRQHEFGPGDYGLIHIDPGIVTLHVRVVPSKTDPEWMKDIEVAITPHKPGVTPDMLKNVHVAIDDGGKPSRAELWRLLPLSDKGTVKFHENFRRVTNRLRFVFNEEREERRRQNAEKYKGRIHNNY